MMLSLRLGIISAGGGGGLMLVALLLRIIARTLIYAGSLGTVSLSLYSYYFFKFIINKIINNFTEYIIGVLNSN